MALAGRAPRRADQPPPKKMINMLATLLRFYRWFTTHPAAYTGRTRYV